MQINIFVSSVLIFYESNPLINQMNSNDFVSISIKQIHSLKGKVNECWSENQAHYGNNKLTHKVT